MKTQQEEQEEPKPTKIVHLRDPEFPDHTSDADKLDDAIELLAQLGYTGGDIADGLKDLRRKLKKENGK